jgi:hypothetical protein
MRRAGLSRPDSPSLPLRRHPSLRGRWPAHPQADRPDAAALKGEEDVLEAVTLGPGRMIFMRSYHEGVTYYRTLCLTRKSFAQQLAAFLKSRLGERLAEIGDTMVDFKCRQAPQGTDTRSLPRSDHPIFPAHQDLREANRQRNMVCVRRRREYPRSRSLREEARH